MNKTMEVEVRRRSSKLSQTTEMANVRSPPTQHSEKRLPNKGSQQSSSMLNQLNNDHRDEWQCPECSEKAHIEVQKVLKRMNKTMEVEVRRRSSRLSQTTEMANVRSPSTQHSEKRLPNKGSQQSSSMLNQLNNDHRDEWQCPECSEKEAVARKLLEMEKNKPPEVNIEDGGQMPETETQNSPADLLGYCKSSWISSPKTNLRSTGVTSKSSDSLHGAFILKVDCFTTLLLSITIGIISGLIYWNVLQGWQQKNPWFCLTLLPATSVLLFINDHCEKNCKKFPLNLILPLMSTIIYSLVLGVVSSIFAPMTVMQAGGITAFLTLMLSWVALKSKLTGTRETGPPWMVISVLVIFGIVCSFTKSPILQLSYALGGMLSFATHLMMTQVGIRRESTEDQKSLSYTLPALKLYMDIVNLFFFMLQLMVHGSYLMAWDSQPQGQGQQ